MHVFCSSHNTRLKSVCGMRVGAMQQRLLYSSCESCQTQITTQVETKAEANGPLTRSEYGTTSRPFTFSNATKPQNFRRIQTAVIHHSSHSSLSGDKGVQVIRILLEFHTQRVKRTVVTLTLFIGVSLITPQLSNMLNDYEALLVTAKNKLEITSK